MASRYLHGAFPRDPATTHPASRPLEPWQEHLQYPTHSIEQYVLESRSNPAASVVPPQRLVQGLPTRLLAVRRQSLRLPVHSLTVFPLVLTLHFKVYPAHLHPCDSPHFTRKLVLHAHHLPQPCAIGYFHMN